MSLGVYPTVSLKEAREKRDDLRKGISNGVDPKEAAKQVLIQAQQTFGNVAQEWFDKRQKNVHTEDHCRHLWSRVEHFILPVLGSRQIREIKKRADNHSTQSEYLQQRLSGLLDIPNTGRQNH
ncbi:MAG: integrase arm-type DNA-binding domain-containing protein [Synergistaceae bacterium]|nr:integrase arm-type DNA-binding domain-containing protein [Synergistaceae bacterium]